MNAIRQDLKYGLGHLRRNPGYAATAILSLALGIAANTVFFTIFDTFSLRRLPVERPEQLVQIRSANAFQTGISWGSPVNTYSYPLYQDLLERSPSFSGLICRSNRMLNLNYRGAPERVQAELVSGNYFDVLGVPPALGRVLASKDEPGAQSSPVAVLSYGYWMRRFGGNPAVLGDTLVLERQAVAIVGVASSKFHGVELGKSPDVYLPVTLGNRYYSPGILKDRRYIWLQIIGRLNSGVTREQAAAALSPVFGHILENDMGQSPGIPDYIKERYSRQSLDLQPGAQGVDSLQRMARQPILILWLAVLAVLLIACANVAGLQLAQAVRRRKEIALRLGLGAGRWRLARLLLTESIVLAFLGGAAGLMIAWWALGGLRQLILTFMPLDDFSGLNLRVLGLTAAVSSASVLIFGLAPALHAARSDLLTALRSEGTAVSSRFHDLGRSILAISQIALSVLLLAIAGLFLRTLINVYRIDPGFPREKLMVVRFNPQPDQYTPARAGSLAQALAETVRTLRGVTNVFLANDSILSISSITEVRAEGHENPGKESLAACEKHIAPGYFSGLGIPILAGRDFSKFDTEKSPWVAIVNQAFARYFFGGGDPIGRRFQMGHSRREVEIVGLVGNAAFGSLRDKEQRLLFLCLNQTGFYSGALHIRMEGDPRQLAHAVRQEMALLDPAFPLWEIKTAEEMIEDDAKGERALALMTAIFGAVATILAAIGIFGLLSFLVAQRTREVGIRMALGAKRAGICRLILKQVLALTAIGLIAGICAAAILSQYTRSFLYEVRPVDPASLALSAFLIAVVALCASLVPARRAAAIDPMTALRHE
jgi:predicted permease